MHSISLSFQATSRPVVFKSTEISLHSGVRRGRTNTLHRAQGLSSQRSLRRTLMEMESVSSPLRLRSLRSFVALSPSSNVFCSVCADAATILFFFNLHRCVCACCDNFYLRNRGRERRFLKLFHTTLLVLVFDQVDIGFFYCRPEEKTNLCSIKIPGEFCWFLALGN